LLQNGVEGTKVGLPNKICKNSGQFLNSDRSELCHNS